MTNYDAHLNKVDLSALQSNYRTNFINSLSGYKSANLIGTSSPEGIDNLAIFSSVVHLGANPALVGFINRPHTVERHTLENIYATGCYTVNHVAHSFYQDAHHTAARYAADKSEFKMTGLTPEFFAFDAPYVKQSLIKYGVEFRQKIDIEINKTILVIGEIVEVFCDESYIEEDGKINIAKAETTSISGLDEYHISQSLGRQAYAKPKK